MKDGLSFHGLQAELSGGSFGDGAGHLEYGARFGDWGLYLSAGGLHDDGFRYHSPTRLRQVYADLAYDHDGLSGRFSVTADRNDIAAAGPTPVQMLASDPRSIFTHPQAMSDDMAMVQAHGTYRVSRILSLTGQVYYRRFRQRLIDGNTTDITYCDNNAAQLCLEGLDDYPGDALFDAAGHRVSAGVLPNGATPGETDFTRTTTDSLGGALQVRISASVARRANNLVLGASIDRGLTSYGAFGELGALGEDLAVTPVGVIIDQALSPTAQPPIEAPVSVTAFNLYEGVYGVDVLDLTPRLSWTVSGRFNLADLSLRDPLASSLNATHRYERLNPATGFTYRLSKTLTAYLSYSEANRAPTAGELSCANPSSPCLLDAFLVSDPALKQVVSHTVEAGLRGRFKAAPAPGWFDWSFGAYRADTDNDILLLASDINGFGYFHNVRGERRQGADVQLGYTDRRWSFNASYAYLDAIFRGHDIVSSDSPAANSDGLIQVRPGDHLPLSPTHRITVSMEYAVTHAWSLGASLRMQSRQYLMGDDSNQEPRLPGFMTAQIETRYRLSRRLELFSEIDNIFDRRFFTYGAFVALGGLPTNLSLSDPRTYSPSPGRSFRLGARMEFQ
jgi:iron complex outermembrane receptor protein